MVTFTKTQFFFVSVLNAMVHANEVFDALTAAVDGEITAQAAGLYVTAMTGLNSILDVTATLVGAAG